MDFMNMLPSRIQMKSRVINTARLMMLVTACAAILPLSAAEKSSTSRSSPQPLVTYGGETLTRAELDQMIAAQRQAMQANGGRQSSAQLPKDTDLMIVYGWLREEALRAAADEMKVQPDQKEVRKQEQELRKQLTPENWKKMQAGGQFALQAVERYRAGLQGGAKNDAQLRSSVWQELGGDRNPAGVPKQAFDQTLDACGRDDAAYRELKAAIPQSPDDAVSKAREEFAELSRLMQVQNRIAGNVKVTGEELARAKQAIPAGEQQQMAKAPGGFEGALTAMKKQQAVDEWLRPRILSQAKISDRNIASRFRAMLTPEQDQAGRPQQQQSPAGSPSGTSRRR